MTVPLTSIEIHRSDVLQCELFSKQYVPCIALNHFRCDDIDKVQDQVIEIKVMSTPDTRRLGIADQQFTIPINRIKLTAIPRGGAHSPAASDDAVATSSELKVCVGTEHITFPVLAPISSCALHVRHAQHMFTSHTNK